MSVFLPLKDLRYAPIAGTIITDKTMISKDDKSSGIRAAEKAPPEYHILAALFYTSDLRVHFVSNPDFSGCFSNHRAA